EATVTALRAAGASVACCLSIGGVFPETVVDFLSQRAIPFGDVGPLGDTTLSAQPTMSAGNRVDTSVAPADETSQATGSASLADWEIPIKRRVAGALLDIRAVVINSQIPFRYASGLLSPIYTDCRLLISNPTQWRVVVDAFVDVIHHHVDAGEVDALA